MTDYHEFHVTDGEGTDIHLIISKNLVAEEIQFYQKLINDHLNHWINNSNKTKGDEHE